MPFRLLFCYPSISRVLCRAQMSRKSDTCLGGPRMMAAAGWGLNSSWMREEVLSSGYSDLNKTQPSSLNMTTMPMWTFLLSVLLSAVNPSRRASSWGGKVLLIDECNLRNVGRVWRWCCRQDGVARSSLPTLWPHESMWCMHSVGSIGSEDLTWAEYTFFI